MYTFFKWWVSQLIWNNLDWIGKSKIFAFRNEFRCEFNSLIDALLNDRIVFHFIRLEWSVSTFFFFSKQSTCNNSVRIPNATCEIKFCLVDIVIFAATKSLIANVVICKIMKSSICFSASRIFLVYFFIFIVKSDNWFVHFAYRIYYVFLWHAVICNMYDVRVYQWHVQP